MGDNAIVVTVTAENTTTQAYTMTVTRAAGNARATGKPVISGGVEAMVVHKLADIRQCPILRRPLRDGA